MGTAETIRQLQKRCSELEEEIAETRKRLPAHSTKPALMMELLALEDEYDALVKQIRRLKESAQQQHPASFQRNTQQTDE